MDQAQSSWRCIIHAVIAAAVAGAVMVGVAHGQGKEAVYVVNVASDDVSVIDPSANAVVATIPVGRQPNGIAVTPDGRTVYVSNLQDDTVSVIDALGRAVVGTVHVGDEPVGVALAPDGSRAYVTNRRSNTVSVIDTHANAVVTTIADGIGPGSNGIALTPDGGFAYVNNAGSRDPGTLSVIDTALAQTVGSVEVARNPKRVAISPDGLTAYVANFRSWNISVVDLLTNTFTTGLRVSGRTVGVAVHPNGQYAYITNLDGTVEIVETSSKLLIAPITVGREPYSIALSRQGGTAYVANLGDDTVSVVDLATDLETDIVRVGDKPFALAVGCIGADCDLPPVTPKPSQTATPSPTITTTPTITLTRPPTETPTFNPHAAQLRVGSVSAQPGETVEVPVTFDSRGAALAGIQLDLHYAAPLAFVANSDNAPDCTLVAAIRKELLPTFHPPGCSPIDPHDCTGVRVLVLSLQNVDAIPSPLTLFSCRVRIAADAVPGDYALGMSNVETSTEAGMAYDTIGFGGTVTVVGSAAHALRLSNTDGLCTGGWVDGEVCHGDGECDGGGACAHPSSVCDGGPDDGLLCGCPGGACESDVCPGDSSRGTCRGGRAEGACCDTDFQCAGGRPCQSTARICAAGVAKGLPCLSDRHCPGSTCASPGTICRGGSFDRFTCIDTLDCPAGDCVWAGPVFSPPSDTPVVGPEGRTPRPSSTPQPTLFPATDGSVSPGSSAGGGGGCAVVPTPSSGSEWLLVLALIAARYGRRRP